MVNSALGGPAGWLLLLLSIAVLTIGFERLRFWLLWWKRRQTLRLQWTDALRLGDGAPSAWMEERDLEMRFGQTFLEGASVIAPLIGLIGTVFGVSRLLSAMGPQLLVPPGGSLNGLGEALLSTGLGLLVSLVATVIWQVNNGLRQWQLSLWRRDRHRWETTPMAR
ncbi:MAG: MotA/TolQ/ExbB proton channel family protein [Cyanobacteriota bacterium]|nr:MotA/TolQ/ExbB proton channel family protein [Cyanobacteriota bacterium]